ncbi:MAG: N-acetylglucosamine-6-phosphate deacetylase, partial [Traorella sp.]
MIIQSQRVYIDEQFMPAQLVLENGKIAHIQEWGKDKADRDYQNQRIIPGLIEMHAHGYNGMDVNYATYDGLKHWFKELPKEGVTSVFPTSSTAPLENLLASFELISNLMDEGVDGANILGIHTEGRYISFSHKGAHNPYLIAKPSVEEFKKWQEVTKNRIKLVTIAPEMDVNHELIKYCRSQGIHVSIGHTGASYDECMKAYQDGAENFTHTFNGMKGLHHREPGTAGAALSNDDMYAELICDGVHVHFSVCKIVATCKGKDRLILITDAVQ